MKYLALIYADESTAPGPESPEWGALMEAYGKAQKVFEADGVFVSGEPLEAATTATTVRVRNGKTETMDGPFAETKEQLGGFYMFECENLDQALKYAAMIPSAEYGSVEVRPVMNMQG